MTDKKKGFTLIELLVVVSLLSVVLGISVYTLSGLPESLRLKADQATTELLNRATKIYMIEESLTDEEVFSLETDDSARILLLQNLGYLTDAPKAQADGGSFVWSGFRARWLLYLDGVPVGVSKYGRNFTEISDSLVDIMVERYEDKGSYGRTWGDYRYSDLGLDPDIWKDPGQHMLYVPSGSNLLVHPEKGYRFRITLVGGQSQVVQDSHNLIYNAPQEKWFYYSVAPVNEVNIDSLEVFRKTP